MLRTFRWAQTERRPGAADALARMLEPVLQSPHVPPSGGRERVNKLHVRTDVLASYRQPAGAAKAVSCILAGFGCVRYKDPRTVRCTVHRAGPSELRPAAHDPHGGVAVSSARLLRPDNSFVKPATVGAGLPATVRAAQVIIGLPLFATRPRGDKRIRTPSTLRTPGLPGIAISLTDGALLYQLASHHRSRPERRPDHPVINPGRPTGRLHRAR